MKLLMISGDRSVLEGKMGAFFYTLQELRKHWDRIDIICPKVSSSELDAPESGHRIGSSDGKGGEVYFHPSPRSLLFQCSWIYTCGKKLIKEQNHDVMTVHDYPPFYNSCGAWKLHKKTGVPYALEVHHIVGWPKAASVAEWIGKVMTRWHMRRRAARAAGVRVVNTTVQKKLIEWGVPEKIIAVVPSFYLDRDILTADLRPPIAYDVSFCGRLVGNKGLRELIMAVSELHDVRLLIIGDGPLRSEMEALTQQLDIQNRVTFLGWLPTQEAVFGAIQTARMFVMNSTSEGGPRVALEAMGCGMPVLSTKVGVMPEVITDGKNGMFTDGSTEDLVKKIGMLLQSDSQREQMGKEAVHILDTYERATLIKQYADFLKSLA